MMTFRRIAGSLLIALGGMAVPATAAAYLTPEEVLLRKEYILPPRAGGRGADQRADQQAAFARERQQREFQEAYDAQHPPEPEPEPELEEPLHNAAPEPESILSAEDRELLNTLRLLERRDTRLLERVDARQRTLEYYGEERLHGGAPQPLAPTGAGAWLAAAAMIGAVTWTLRRAGKRWTVVD